VPLQLLLASSNPGKLCEIQALAAGRDVRVELLSEYASLPWFEESAPTFAENAAGKALHYSRLIEGLVVADDSGLVVPALGGAPGVQSARYAGAGASDAERIEKLLRELQGSGTSDRRARFVCVVALASLGRALAVISDSVGGELLPAPRGTQGFGYDPVFYFPALKKTFAELAREEKNRFSHRGKAFGRLFEWLERMHRSPANP
jgi:XTP/dITP diphosphohydrolase